MKDKHNGYTYVTIDPQEQWLIPQTDILIGDARQLVKWDHDEQTFANEEFLQRNQFGVRMYDAMCQLCREHVEDWYTCELCNQRAMISLIHLEDVLGRKTTKKRVESNLHHCPFTRQILRNFLL